MKENSEWFVDWFDSPYYHLLYENRDEQEANNFLKKLLHTLNPSHDAHVLDLACGKGRHCQVLCKDGYAVTGLDLSKQNIEEAKILTQGKVDLIRQDMREPFGINQYDVVLNLFTSFGYFNALDNQKIIQNVHQALKSDGYFVIDYLNPSHVVRHLIHEEEVIKENVIFFIQRKIIDDTILKTITVKDGKMKYSFKEEVSLFSRDYFSNLLRQNHLKLHHVYGDYHLTPYEGEKSDRLILIAQKRA